MMKMTSKVLYILVALVIGFSDMALSQEDPCAAYVSQSGIARCKDRILKIGRMKQAKEGRQERNKSFKERMKSRNSSGDEAVAAVESSENTETASALTADSMTDEEMREEVSKLREKLKLLDEKSGAVSESGAEEEEGQVEATK